MAGSHDDGWGSVFSDLDADGERAPSTDTSRRPEPDEEEATDPGLPTPAGRPPGPAIAADEAPTETAAPAPAAFREEDLLSTLEGSPAPVQPPESSLESSSWREYRELIATAVIGVAALAAAIAWGRWRPEAVEEAPPSPPSARETSPPPRRAEPPPPEPRAAPPKREPRETRTKAALPMLSVVTRPPGALVRIDGVVYGRTPLIMQAPSDRERFEVELRLDDHRPWTGIVAKDDAGHFSINTELEPRGR